MRNITSIRFPVEVRSAFGHKFEDAEFTLGFQPGGEVVDRLTLSLSGGGTLTINQSVGSGGSGGSRDFIYALNSIPGRITVEYTP